MVQLFGMKIQSPTQKQRGIRLSEKKSNKPGKMAGLFVQLKNIFGLNIATVAFGVLLLYMIFTAFLLVTSTHIESYQVTTGPLSRNETYTGISLREESVFKAESSGYVNYYAREEVRSMPTVLFTD